MDLFGELERSRPDPAIPSARREPSPAAKRAMRKKRAEEAERLPAAAERIGALTAGAPDDLQCRAPCPTVLAAPDELHLLCAGCRWAMARAGIVVDRAS